MNCKLWQNVSKEYSKLFKMWSKHWAIGILIVSQSDIDWQNNDFFIAIYLEYDETIKALVFIDSLKIFLLIGMFVKERLGRQSKRIGKFLLESFKNIYK